MRIDHTAKTNIKKTVLEYDCFNLLSDNLNAIKKLFLIFMNL